MRHVYSFIFFLILSVISIPALATFLPPNDLDKEDKFIGADRINMTEDEFNATVNGVVEKMKPSFDLFGAHVVVSAKWNDSTVNAYANRSLIFPKVWKLHFFGGLARRPEITKDGFALVICHEIGHHLGGFPFYNTLLNRWAAAEGEADYFATHVCARKIWGNDKVENARYRSEVDATAKAGCDSIWQADDDKNLCYRTAAASSSLALLLARLSQTGATPQFGTPDRTVVKSTYSGHPNGQCRLDTYFAGSICPVEWNDKVIPGRHPFKNQSGINVEQEMAKYSCTKSAGYSVGVRPACWFNARM